MKTSILSVTLLFFAALFCIENTYSQTCSSSAPVVGACSGGNGAVSNNTNINNGNTYWYTGSGTVTNVNLNNGGTLRICGTLTLTSFNFNGGSIIVESGGSLSISGGFNMNGNTSITNRGNLTINGSIVMQNNNNTIWNNSTTSSLAINGSVTINAGTNNIYNKGAIAISNTLSIQGGGICMEDNAIINTAILNNTSSNNLLTWNGSSSSACVGVTNSAQVGSHTLTGSSNIKVCLKTGFTYTSGNASNWGVTPNTNCSSCLVVLPINDIQLKGTFQNNEVNITWSQNGSISPEDVFSAEESDNGTDFHSIAIIAANANKSVYAFSEYDISAAIQYYRIKQTDGYGVVYYSNTIAVKTKSISTISVYPNPAVKDMNILMQSNVQETISIQLADISGKIFSSKQLSLLPGKNKFNWDTSHFSPGTYVLTIQSPSQGNITRLVSVLRQ